MQFTPLVVIKSRGALRFALVFVQFFRPRTSNTFTSWLEVTMEVEGTVAHAYCYSVFATPAPTPPQFACGDAVFVLLRSQRDTGRAVVVEPAVTDGSSEPELCGRVKVKFDADGSVHHVRLARLIKVHPRNAGKTVIICGDTRNFRLLARSQPRAGDRVVEVGSSFGRCTALLAAVPGVASVVGIDTSQEAVADARRTYPSVRFECFDVFVDKQRFVELAGGCTQCFVDIGGNRGIDAVSMLLPFIQDCVSPDLIVIKSAELKKLADAQIQAASPDCPTSVVPDGASWWQQLVARSKANAVAHRSINLGLGSQRCLHPLRYPAKTAPNGRLVCRYHNYLDCKKAQACPYDHEHCHCCLQPGHLAKVCSAFA
eukprot:TRINITY_DN11227_c0_g1_i1.p1 TRINITY_DN11227_c0_g1~~TRINITY_DN11227_c0_g1_i1.p1  ORF type:complete len:378 (+),score=88.10 TRINITY_DN11227_c0_g1_i1:24-1136(+)